MRSYASTACTPPHAETSYVRRFTKTAVAAFRYMTLSHSVWRERQHLADLDSRMLEDIGLTQSDVKKETGRAYFDLPSNRLLW